MAALLAGFAACKKEPVTPSNNTGTTPKKSKLELLCQTWILDETYEDGTKKTSGGTDRSWHLRFYIEGFYRHRLEFRFIYHRHDSQDA